MAFLTGIIRPAGPSPLGTALAAALLALGAPAEAGGLGRYLAAKPSDGSAFAPVGGRHAVEREDSVVVRMRDGARLSVDIYRPAGLAGRVPVILIRTPYGKHAESRRDDGRMFASHGYVVVVADVRGRYRSEGVFTVGDDRSDGLDLMDWIVAQPWAEPAIGTFGCSYLGENQLSLMAGRHPAHRAALPMAAGGGVWSAAGSFTPFADSPGVKPLAQLVGWYRAAGHKYSAFPRSAVSDEALKASLPFVELEPKLPVVEDWDKVYRTLPTIDALAAAGAPPTDYERHMAAEHIDPWWGERGYLSAEDRTDTPALHINNWFDAGVASTLRTQAWMEQTSLGARARAGQYAVIAPMTHCQHDDGPTDRTVVGALPIGDARLNFYRLYLDWFDHQLRGKPSPFAAGEHVHFYVMGENRWRAAPRWPLPDSRSASLFLGSRTGANSRHGDGSLGLEPPERARADRFFYDPANPVPTLGGGMCCWPNDDERGAGSYDQAPIEIRNDVLVYRSGRLADGVTIAGAPVVNLQAISSARDTDFVVKLVDIDPEGRSFNIAEQIVRARYRNGLDRPQLLEAGRSFQVTLQLNDIAYRFAPGHRIGLLVTSSSFPAFERNLNSGGPVHLEVEPVVAENQLLSGGAQPSVLRLPVAPWSAMPSFRP